MIPIKRADKASTGFVIYQYHKIQRAGDDHLRGKEKAMFEIQCRLHPQGINRQTFNSNLL